jgi:outer membrane lipase/esterase
VTGFLATPALLSLSLVSPAFGQGRTGMVVFGDSLSDPGNHFIEFGTTALQPFAPIPDASYAIGGHHFTNGPTWAEQVANALHMPNSGSPALRTRGVFTNYAFGRARSRQCLAVAAACPAGQYPFGVVDLGFEVSHFLSDFAGSAPPANLYIVEFGGNDLDDALTALQTDSSGATSIAIIQAAVLAEAGSLQALYSAGARNFLIVSAANLAFTPFVQSLGPIAQFVATQFAAAYNGGMNQALALIANHLSSPSSKARLK